jgi:uncharacterized coiled-coil DUF342 family protein
MGLKEAYHEKLEAQLREWNAKLDQLKARADGAEASVKLEYYKQIESIKAKADVLQAKLKELQESSGEAWESLKGGVERAWTDFKTAIEEATGKFK